MLLFWLSTASTSLFMLTDVGAIDSSVHHGDTVESQRPGILHHGDTALVFNDAHVMDLVRNMVKVEVDKRWSKLVSDLKRKVTLQDKRIKYLEGREKRMAIERLISRVTNLEKKNENVHKLVAVKKRKGSLKEWETAANYQENMQTGQSETMLDSKSKSMGVQSRGGWQKPTDGSLPVSMSRRQATRAVTNVAFTAYLDHDISQLMPGQAIIMNRVLENDGNGYDSNTGVFVAPIDGMYLFSFHFNIRNRYVRLRLVVDHGNKVGAFSNPHDGFSVMSGNTVVLRLIKGQSVWVDTYIMSGEIQADDTSRFCTFSGVLLYS